MKKRRIVAFALATTMLASSMSFNAFADEAAVLPEAAVEETVVDEAVSDSAVAVSETADETVDDKAVLYSEPEDGLDRIGGLAYKVSGPWRAAVFGDAGGKEKVMGFNILRGALTMVPGAENEAGETVPYYVVAEREDGTVNTRMGIYDAANQSSDANVGKISGSTDGIVYYYQELNADDDFVLSASGTVNTIDNTNSQVSFGAMARDYVIELDADTVDVNKVYVEGDATTSNANFKNLTYDNTLNTNYVAAGPLRMAAFGSSTNPYIKSFYRLDGTLYNYESSSADARLYSNAEGVPQPGETYNVKLIKSDNYYYLQFGDEDGVVIDNVPLGNDEGKIYAGLFAARNADISWSDINLDVIDATALEIVELPETVVVVGDKFSSDGLVAKATLADGSTVTLTPDDDIIISEIDTDTVGTKTVYVSYGGQTVSFDVSVEVNSVVNMTLVYEPIQNEFCVGAKFNTTGMEITAEYINRTETLNNTQYVITIDGKEIDENYYFTADMAGTHTVKVSYIGTESIEANGKFVTYDITVVPADLATITYTALPVTTTYSVGDVFDPSGLVIRATYQTESGLVYKTLNDTEYTYVGIDANNNEYDLSEAFDSDKLGTQTILVKFNNDTSKTCTFTVEVVEKLIVKASVKTYPRLTYAVGEAFDTSGLTMQITYNNGDIEDLNEFTVNTDGFDSSVADTTTSVVIETAYGSVTLKASIVASSTHYWKPAILGQSSMGAYDGDRTSNITVYNPDGSSVYVCGDPGEIIPEVPVGIMTDGNFENVDKVNITSWDGAGKYATDHDGMAYYYTRIDADNNFKISADITVNRYIRDPVENGTESQQADYEVVQKAKTNYQKIFNTNGINITVTDEMALDMSRSGQEAFGIIARDVIPLYAPTELGGNDNLVTTDINVAVKDKYGEPMNIFDAYIGKEAGDLESDITFSDINDIAFSSNVVIAGGATSSTYPTDPTSSSYYTKSVQNRINLSYRSGVTDIDGAGSNTKGGFYTTTDSVPKPGDVYTVTLERINYGFALTTTDHQTGVTKTVYCFDAADGLQNLLTTQDADNIYVGFFACRYADIDIENIHLYETDAANDPIINDLTEEVYSPVASVQSALYTNTTDYTLQLKASNPYGGLVTIKLNDKVVYEGSSLSKKITSFPVTLKPDYANEFTVVYTPSKADNLSSYEDVVSRFYVTHKLLDTTLENIYVSPTGTVAGEGTRENPIDLETAIGLVKRGQKIIMLDGVYTVSGEIKIEETNTGTATSKKYLWADEGANPVIDLQGTSAGLLVYADYWHFKGITTTNSQGNSKPFHIGGQHNIVENCTSHDNGDVGIQISRLDSSDNIDDWPADNLIINCEVYNNCDPSKNNADGFACKLTVGNNNVFKNCVSHHNLDDGWDLYTKLSTGKIGIVQVEGCVTYRQGYKLLEDGTDVSWGATSGGNGFKAGGESIYVKHYFKDGLSFLNKGYGFDTNTNPTIKLRNIIAYNNELNNIALYSTKRSLFDYDIEGYVSYKDENGTDVTDMIGSLTEYQAFKNNSETPLVSESNYFMYDADFLSDNAYGITGTVGTSYNANSQPVTADMFKSLNLYDSVDSNMRYPRAEDGSFIFGDFLARTTPYVHKTEDLVTMPDTGSEGSEGGNVTEATEATTSGGTTSSGSTSGSSGGGGGSITGGGSSSAVTTTAATVEETTETTTKAVTAPDIGANDDTAFDDIESRPWAVEAINALAELGIVNGVGDRKFAPDANCKRADFVIILVNLLGIEGTAVDNFDDVDADKYYANAVGLAKEAGIVNGYGDGNFGPEDYCTREALMVMVANALAATGADITADETVLDAYADADEISEWARPYVAYLTTVGAVSGTGANLEPQANITRAQVAVLMYNVLNIIVDEPVEEIADETIEEVTEEVEEEVTEEITEEAVEEAEAEIAEETAEETTEEVAE